MCVWYKARISNFLVAAKYRRDSPLFFDLEMLAYRQCNATTDLGADTLTDADKRRDLRRTKRRLAIRQQRQRRRDARNRLYATIPEGLDFYFT